MHETAAVDGIFADEIMAVRTRCHLRRMCHRNDLVSPGKTRKARADGVGNCTAHGRIHLEAQQDGVAQRPAPDVAGTGRPTMPRW